MSLSCNQEIHIPTFPRGFLYSVHQLHNLLQKDLEQSLTKAKAISFSQFVVLIGFACSLETPLSQRTIAEYSHLTEATISRHITTLVSLGYLSKEENKENRRKHKIMITKKGLTAFKKAEEVIDKELATLFTDIIEKDKKSIMKNFNTILTKLLSKE